MKGKLKLLILPLLILVTVLGFGLTKVNAEEATETLNNAKVKIYFFRGEGCPHCAEAEEWFEKNKDGEGKYFEVVSYEVWYDESNKELMNKVAKHFNEDVSGVPYIIVGDKTFQGFSEEYGSQIVEKVHEEYVKNVDDRYDVMVKLNGGNSNLVTYIIVGALFAVVVFVIVARFVSPDAQEINYEDDNKYVDEADEEREVEEKLEKALSTPNKPKKATTKKAAPKKAETKKEPVKKTEAKKTTKKTTTSKTKKK